MALEQDGNAAVCKTVMTEFDSQKSLICRYRIMVLRLFEAQKMVVQFYLSALSRLFITSFKDAR